MESCLSVVRSDWKVLAAPISRLNFCPPREGPLETTIQPEAIIYLQKRYKRKHQKVELDLWDTTEFGILLVYAWAVDTIFSSA
jgi:hypothetical protein